MHILNLLKETPLPDDWDKALYSDKVPFKKRIEYAKSKAKRLGGGSGRVAFEIPYSGRKTVLKVAKNRKGMAQNEQEIGLFNAADMLGAAGEVVVPMIDYDENSSQPTWIHVEHARKLKSEQEFKRLTGFELRDILMYAANLTSNRSLPMARDKKFDDEFKDSIWDNEYGSDLVSFIGNTELHLPDLMRASNWGVFNGKPVIIDLGLSDDIYKQYYS